MSALGQKQTLKRVCPMSATLVGARFPCRSRQAVGANKSHARLFLIGRTGALADVHPILCGKGISRSVLAEHLWLTLAPFYAAKALLDRFPVQHVAADLRNLCR